MSDIDMKNLKYLFQIFMTTVFSTGSVIHSHNYREPETYQDRRVLLVGSGPSGLDLATHLTNFTKKLVHSHHLKYNQPNFGASYKKKPDIKAFTSDGVVFEDDSFEELDDVILCTGEIVDGIKNKMG